MQAESLFKEWQWLLEPLMKLNSGLKKDWQRRQRSIAEQKQIHSF